MFWAAEFVVMNKNDAKMKKADRMAMEKMVDEAGINNFKVEETALVPAQLNAHPIIFIHSLKQHNDIVNQDNFRLMLENEPFLRKL